MASLLNLGEEIPDNFKAGQYNSNSLTHLVNQAPELEVRAISFDWLNYKLAKIENG